MSQPVRVLQSVGGMNHGGIEHFLMNLYRHIDRSKVQFDFLYKMETPCIFDSEIIEMGGRIFGFQSPNKHPLSSWRYYIDLFTEHPEFHVIHEHMSDFSGALGPLRAAKMRGLKTRIAHSHNSSGGLQTKSSFDDIIKAITHNINRRHAADCATDYFACSTLASEWLFGGDPRCAGKVRIIHNGIDASHFKYSAEERSRIRSKYEIGVDSFVIGHVGRFAPVKNQSYLLDILNYMVGSDHDVYLLFVGDGDLRGEAERRSSELGLDGRVRFLGIQGDPAPFYSAMDAFCMPSIFEGLPVSCVEAQANGLAPILSSSIDRGVNICGRCTFVNLESPISEWSSRLLSSARTPVERASGVNEICGAGFDIGSIADGLTEFYLERSNVPR